MSKKKVLAIVSASVAVATVAGFAGVFLYKKKK